MRLTRVTNVNSLFLKIFTIKVITITKINIKKLKFEKQKKYKKQKCDCDENAKQIKSKTSNFRRVNEYLITIIYIIKKSKMK